MKVGCYITVILLSVWVKVICQPENICFTMTGVCKNGGICRATLGLTTYNCSCTPEFSGENCARRVFHTNGNCTYHINNNVNEKKTFTEAKSACSTLHGSVAMIKTELTKAFLKKKISDMYGSQTVFLRLGGESKWPQYQWQWIDGDSIAADRPSSSRGTISWNGKAGRYGSDTTYSKLGWICEAPVTGQVPCVDWHPCIKGRCQKTACQWKCKCLPGYGGTTCGEALITITSPKQVVGSIGDNVPIKLKITSSVGSINVIPRRNNVILGRFAASEGIYFYNIGITEGSGGTYTFTTIPYGFETTTIVIISESVYVDRSFIYSPTQDSPTYIVCTSGGAAKPKEFGWYRNNGSKVITGRPSIGIYQTFRDAGKRVRLNVENALPSDQGNYTCYASDDEANSANGSSAIISLEVYRSPDVFKLDVNNCLKTINLTVTWEPDKQTNTVRHKFRLSSRNTKIAETVQVYEKGQRLTFFRLTFFRLKQSTQYNLDVFVCPQYGCIEKLKKSKNFTTSHFFPGEVRSPTIRKINSSFCEVKWMKVNDGMRYHVTGYNVTWTESTEESTFGRSEERTGSHFVSSDTLKYNINARPNSRYKVRVAARSCTGEGEMTLASGQCITSERGDEKSFTGIPSSIPKPSLVLASQSDGRRILHIDKLSNENGLISCIFLIVATERYTSEGFTNEDLKLANKSVTRIGAPLYIAVSAPHDRMETNQVLGDGTSSKCNPYTALNSPRTGSSLQSESLYLGKNWELSLEKSYRVFQVVSFLINKTITLRVSDVLTLQKITNGNDKIQVPTAAIIGGLVCLAVVVISLLIFQQRRRKQRTAAFPDKSSKFSEMSETHRGNTGGKSEEDQLRAREPANGNRVTETDHYVQDSFAWGFTRWASSRIL